MRSPAHPTAHPAADADGDDIDQDCSGEDGVDADGDGVASEGSGGADCDDDDAAVNPAAEEDKGGLDLDCDGEVDPSKNCGCASTEPASYLGVAALLGAVVLRRRRRVA